MGGRDVDSIAASTRGVSQPASSSRLPKSLLSRLSPIDIALGLALQSEDGAGHAVAASMPSPERSSATAAADSKSVRLASAQDLKRASADQRKLAYVEYGDDVVVRKPSPHASPVPCAATPLLGVCFRTSRASRRIELLIAAGDGRDVFDNWRP